MGGDGGVVGAVRAARGRARLGRRAGGAGLGHRLPLLGQLGFDDRAGGVPFGAEGRRTTGSMICMIFAASV